MKKQNKREKETKQKNRSAKSETNFRTTQLSIIINVFINTMKYHPAEDVLNAAQSGALAANLVPHETDYIMQQLKANPMINMEEDWKLLTLLVGANDLCASCYGGLWLNPGILSLFSLSLYFFFFSLFSLSPPLPSSLSILFLSSSSFSPLSSLFLSLSFSLYSLLYAYLFYC